MLARMRMQPCVLRCQPCGRLLRRQTGLLCTTATRLGRSTSRRSPLTRGGAVRNHARVQGLWHCLYHDAHPARGRRREPRLRRLRDDRNAAHRRHHVHAGERGAPPAAPAAAARFRVVASVARARSLLQRASRSSPLGESRAGALPQSKLMAWVSLVLVLSSIFNSRSSQMDCSRIMTALM